MENYQERIDTVFAKWINDYKRDGKNSFVRDGVPFPEDYYVNSPRVLFVLKDPNDIKATYESSQLDAYRDFGEKKIDRWHNRMMPRIAKMYKVLGGKSDKEMSEFEAIKNIAFMNLKKTGGSNCVSGNVIASYTSIYRNRILEQIDIINPDYIICCGCCVQFVKYIMLDLPLNKRVKWRNLVEQKGNNYCFYWKKKDIIVIDMYHPSYTRNKFAHDSEYIKLFTERIGKDYKERL